MIKKTMIATGIALAITTTLTANIAVAEEAASWTDDFEVSGEIKNETAVFTKAGTTIGAATAHKSKDIMKSESSARIFINGPVAEGVEMHAELRPVRDGQAVDGYKGHEDYTQQDFLRELYVDTEVGEEEEVSLRIGKQQVVWGTADGMKLLDIINPTDYREMAQNSMDESRIPVWMINAETDLEDGSNLQVVVSQPKENVFAGLNRDISTAVRRNTASDVTTSGQDVGHAFMMKGVDSITGQTNGFLNIVPDIGSIAGGFSGQFTAAGLQANTGMTVAMFEGMTNVQLQAQAWPPSAVMLKDFVNGTNNSGANSSLSTLDGTQIMNVFAGSYNSNLNAATSSTDFAVVKDSAFEYMGNATFGTFDAFKMAGAEYTYNMPGDTDLDLAFRVKRSLDSGLNYSLNYSYNYDKNPIIDLSWRGDNGALLTTTETVNHFDASGGSVASTVAAGYAYSTTTLSLADSNSNAYGGVAGKTATLRFEQAVKRAHNIGSALDYAVDTEQLGAVVLRGEFLYQKDVYQPVMNLDKLSIGDLVGALQMEKTNRLKYVLGADVTVLTNMMVSAQFIQDRNIDHVENGNHYTADYATMHLTNGFQKAEKNKEFYSFFMSKPFGAEQQHRWNNIFMFEENGGKWNRADVEYSFSDEIIGSAEYNKYWGDENTQFGQLEKSSNFQLGLKYIF